MRDIVASGEIGAPVFFQNVFAGPNPGMKDRWFAKKDLAGGGVLMDTCPHSVDLFRYLIGEVADQKAVMHAHFDGTFVEDAGSLSLLAENGAVGSLGASWVAGASQAFVTIVGRNGMVSYNYLNNKELHVQVNKEPRVEDVQPSVGFPDEIEHFCEVIRSGEAPLCDVTDGLRALEIIQAVYP
jgi:predicted dehydrogenase